VEDIDCTGLPIDMEVMSDSGLEDKRYYYTLLMFYLFILSSFVFLEV